MSVSQRGFAELHSAGMQAAEVAESAELRAAGMQAAVVAKFADLCAAGMQAGVVAAYLGWFGCLPWLCCLAQVC